jgi:hypothetical protein
MVLQGVLVLVIVAQSRGASPIGGSADGAARRARTSARPAAISPEALSFRKAKRASRFLKTWQYARITQLISWDDELIRPRGARSRRLDWLAANP